MAGKRVLVVEDERDIRESLQLALEMEGYEVTGASNGKEGLDALKLMHPQTPCLILLDLMMPIMNGIEFLKQKAEVATSPRIPVVIVSAVADQHRKVSDADAFVRKPVDLDSLLNLVKKFCCSVQTT